VIVATKTALGDTGWPGVIVPTGDIISDGRPPVKQKRP